MESKNLKILKYLYKNYIYHHSTLVNILNAGKLTSQKGSKNNNLVGKYYCYAQVKRTD
jgi:hypothetical protein